MSVADLTRAKVSNDALAYRRAMIRTYREWCISARIQADTLFVTGTKIRDFAMYLNGFGFSVNEIAEAADILIRNAENTGVQVKDPHAVQAYLNGLRERWALRVAG